MEKEVLKVAATQTVPETKAEKSRREMLLERLRQKYPEANMDDEETLYSLISDDYDGYEKDIAARSEADRKITDLFASDPRSADFLMNWAKGENPVLLLIRHFGDEFRDALDDPQLQEKLVEARNEYIERRAKSEKLQEQAKVNLAQSLANLDTAMEKGGYSDEQADDAFEFFDGIVEDAIVNKISVPTWEMVFKAMNYDKDIEAATHEAEVRGRNTKIEEAKLKKNIGADILPDLGSGGGAVAGEEKPNLGALERFAGNDDIWSRGQLRRKK